MYPVNFKPMNNTVKSPVKPIPLEDDVFDSLLIILPPLKF
jgi:hypothetical protein